MNHTEHEAHPTVCALEVSLTFGAPRSASDLHSSLDAFLSELRCTLRADGCKLIGHIKGLAETDGNGHIFFSVTSLDGKAQYKGMLVGEVLGTKLTINAIVYGVGEDSVVRGIREGIERHLGQGAWKAG